MIGWVTAFALTVACEVPLVASCAPRGRRRRAALDALLLNAVTHPLAWLSVSDGLLSWTAVELAVTAAEAVGYGTVTRLQWPRAVGASVLANTVTAALSFAC